MKSKPKLNLTPRPKRETERIICKQFLESHFKEKKEFTQLVSDPPDFQFQSNGKDISIELTSLVKPHIKQKEAAQKRIVDKAHWIFSSMSDLQLRVLVTFSRKELKYSNSFIEERGNEIANQILRICKEFDNTEAIDFRNSRRPFDEYIEKLSISSMNNIEAWQPFSGFLNPPAENEFIQLQIIKKAQKLINYGKRFDENWLLIASNLGHASSAMRFDWIVFNLEHLGFDKIFLYEVRSKEIWEV